MTQQLQRRQSHPNINVEEVNGDLCTACASLLNDNTQVFFVYEHLDYGSMIQNAELGCPLCSILSLHFSSQPGGIDYNQVIKTWISFKARLNDGVTPIVWAQLGGGLKSSSIELHIGLGGESSVPWPVGMRTCNVSAEALIRSPFRHQSITCRTCSHFLHWIGCKSEASPTMASRVSLFALPRALRQEPLHGKLEASNTPAGD